VNEETVRPWLFTILRHIWQNELRRQRHDVRAHAAYQAHADAATVESPEANYSRRLLESEVRQAVDALPEPYREVIVLRELENFTYAEIAAILNCPTGTVMSRLARGRALLRQALVSGPQSSKEIPS
jgi:RNA polymerase sigma-70 factor (ECF subfamily)